MRKARREEVVKKGIQAKFENELDIQVDVCEENGKTLDDLLEDGYMIKCEGCNQILQTNTFFRHASKAQKCKNVYGERLEIMKKEKRKKVRQLSQKKNKAHTQKYQAKYQPTYHAKNKELVSKQKSQKFQENLSAEKEIRGDEYFNNRLLTKNDDLEKRIKRIINAWKDCRGQDVKEFRKSDAMLKNDRIPLEIFNMNERVTQTVKQYESKLMNTIDEWKSRDRKKYNVELEQLFNEWKIYSRKTDDSFKDIEKATGKNLTCNRCIIRETQCYPKCESTIDEKDNKIQKL